MFSRKRRLLTVTIQEKLVSRILRKISQQNFACIGISLLHNKNLKKERKQNNEKIFNKVATGVMVATMAFTALAPVTTMA